MMKKWIDKIGAYMEIGGTRKDIIFLVISAIALICSIFQLIPLPFDIAWVAILLCGVPIIMEAVIGLVTAFDIKADVLVSLALIASVCIGEYFAAGEIAVIMQLGGLLEELTVARARAGIEKLVNLTPQTARVVTDQGERVIPAMEVQVGQLLSVLPGETIPVDGVILTGQTSVNQSVMTGESMPVDKMAGDEVSSGTVNQFGAFTMKATRVGEDSSIQRMIKLVQSADAGKAKIVGLADRWATWIVVIALTAALLTWLVIGEIIRAVTILVVFCPCALVLATPTAIMAAIGNATKHGFLVSEGDALERLAAVSKITFDKTGTLTYGTPKVTEVHSISDEFGDDVIYHLIASAEQMSEHPLGKAIVASYRSDGRTCSPVDEFQMIPGEGVWAHVLQYTVLAGNEKMMQSHHVILPDAVCMEAEKYLAKGCTVIYIAITDKAAGYAVLTDTIREESENTVRRLKQLGVTPVLLTGDNPGAAENLGRSIGITEIHANCLPEDKLTFINAYQKSGDAVCMIGDGINDAPALKTANVGIAMGSVGSDIAVDAADIVLVDDEVKELPHLFALSKRMMTTIKLNLSFSMGLNFVAIILAITGILNPVVGALVHNAGSVLVITNSALLLKWNSK
jgi:heavy metal translocating P-type ATPase